MSNDNAIAEEAEILIEKQRPTGRTAYSDRTSWLMACLSQLTYIRFAPPPLHKSEAKQSFLNAIDRLIDSQRQKKIDNTHRQGGLRPRSREKTARKPTGRLGHSTGQNYRQQRHTSHTRRKQRISRARLPGHRSDQHERHQRRHGRRADAGRRRRTGEWRFRPGI